MSKQGNNKTLWVVFLRHAESYGVTVTHKISIKSTDGKQYFCRLFIFNWFKFVFATVTVPKTKELSIQPNYNVPCNYAILFM